MPPITTHVLDTSQGRPAAGIAVVLSRVIGASSEAIARATTNADGRVTEWSNEFDVQPGTYRLDFDTATYFGDAAAFYPAVSIAFKTTCTNEHYHVPLLLSPFGYSTYRGS